MCLSGRQIQSCAQHHKTFSNTAISVTLDKAARIVDIQYPSRETLIWSSFFSIARNIHTAWAICDKCISTDQAFEDFESALRFHCGSTSVSFAARRQGHVAGRMENGRLVLRLVQSALLTSLHLRRPQRHICRCKVWFCHKRTRVLVQSRLDFDHSGNMSKIECTKALSKCSCDVL